MRVAVTGGTGFVGSHTVKALLDAGHDLRLLVRNPDRVESSLGPLGVSSDDVDVVVADVTDRGSVDAGLAGMEAVVHAASVFTFDPRRKQEVEAINQSGVENVLRAAVDLGLDPIVHVSSTVALLREDIVDDVLTADSPPGNSSMTYTASKARQETFARDLQATGAPVVITHPGSVWGPDDPYGGESERLVRAIVTGRMSMLPAMSIPVVDVRDVAMVHAALMQSGLGPRRFMAGGHAVEGRDMVATVSAAAGRPRTARLVPLAATRPVAMLGDLMRSRGRDLGVGREGVWISTRRARPDNSATEQTLGVTFRPFAGTAADQVNSMRAAGRL